MTPLDVKPRDPSGRWMRRAALVFLVGSIVVLAGFGLAAALQFVARLLR